MHTITSLMKKMDQQEKLVMLTAYDYPSAKLAEAAGVDMIWSVIHLGWSYLVMIRRFR